ncbi:hypothetical protein [Leptolyngbya sp. Heron Island J]|uniref:hypothetical protein n=1 Tax=Leptolyngbya sp. Heron Island J TaxID=1385935 RepID=UPI0003FCBB96|nr:hypothetical protein [Leptolyngbya sp. Heron Island J]
MMLSIYLLSLVYQVKLTGEAIFGSNYYGRFLSVRYCDITDAYIVVLYDIPYIVIENANNHSTIYVSLWLDDLEGFIKSINEIVPPGNPLETMLNESH